MPFTGNEGGSIDISIAAAQIQEFKKEFPNLKTATFLGREIIEAILAQENCVGIRFYYGYKNESGENNLILVGADSDENDLVEGIIGNHGLSCPPSCSIPNDLNGF